LSVGSDEFAILQQNFIKIEELYEWVDENDGNVLF